MNKYKVIIPGQRPMFFEGADYTCVPESIRLQPCKIQQVKTRVRP